MSGRDTRNGDEIGTPSDRTTPAAQTEVHDRFAAEAWSAPPPRKEVRAEEKKDAQDTKAAPAESPKPNYDALGRDVRAEIRSGHSTSEMSENVRRMFEGVPREDRARAVMQAFDKFGFTKYIQTSDGEASITASAYGGPHGIQRPEVKIDVPEDKTVIPTKDAAEAVKKVTDYLTKEPDAIRAHAVLNGYPPSERAEILRQAVKAANAQLGGDSTALIVEDLPGGKQRLSVANLHPASGKDFDANRDVSLSIIVPAEQKQAEKTDGNYQKQAAALKEAITKWDGVEARRILESIPREDRLKVMEQVSHGWDCNQYREEADGTAKVGAGRGIFFPMEEGPWIERDRVNVVQASVPADTEQIKPKDAAHAAELIAKYIDAHDGIYAHRVLNSFPPEERKAILQQSVDYWNQHYNTARDIVGGGRMQVQTETLPDGRERLSVSDSLSILVPRR